MYISALIRSSVFDPESSPCFVLYLIQWSIGPTHFFYHLCDCCNTFTHDHIHVCESSCMQIIHCFVSWYTTYLLSFFPDFSRCHDLWNCRTSKTIPNVCRYRALSLTTPLEYWEQASANAIRSADGQPHHYSDKQRTTCIRTLLIPQLFVLTLYTLVSHLGHSLLCRGAGGFFFTCSSSPTKLFKVQTDCTW